MGLSQFLILRRLFSFTPRSHRTLLTNQSTVRPFSSSPSTGENAKPASLSSRMSFIFDQIDSIEKERTQKDDTLQRIRAWRESKKEKQPTGENEEKVNVDDKVAVLEPVDEKKKGLVNVGVELVHPWPEWIELMERLVQQNYFDCRRKDEDKMISEAGLDAGAGLVPSIMEEMVDEGFDFTRDWRTVQRACINFGKDRFDILRSLSRQDIQILVGFGCPSADRKLVFSAKLLRKHAHLDEGDVCSSCSLRNSCEQAYLLTQKEEEARTIDIMRVLLTYGFHPINGSVVNDSLLKKKSVKSAIRKLLHEIVKLSAVPIDPNLTPPIIRRPPPKVKQAPPPPKKRVGRDDVEMKRGDWLCPKCNFMNFAKNTACLQCDAKRPKRQLLPGEWECPECNFLNYRRNMVCFNCECKRPRDGFTDNQMQERERGPRARLDKISRKEVSDAWNFDFDDNESDGADVAAFEFADSRKLNDVFPASRHSNEDSMTGFEKESSERKKFVRPQEREYSAAGPNRPGVGFDDFDDEEEDDIDSYELDTRQNDSQLPNSSSVNFSDLDIDSESGDDEATNENWSNHPSAFSSSTRNKQASKSLRRKPAFSGSEDDRIDFNSDDDLPVHPNWKSSHVAGFGQRSSSRRSTNFGSDEDSDLSSSAEDFSGDDFPPRHNKVNQRGSSSSTDYGKRGGNQKFRDDVSDEDMRFSRDRSRGKTTTTVGRRKPDKGFDFSEGSGPRSWGKRRSHVDDRGFQGDDYRGSRRNSSEGQTRNLKTRQENFSNNRNGRFNKSHESSGAGSYLDDDRYSRPRINVR